MSEALNENSREERKTDWDMLTELTKENNPEELIQYTPISPEDTLGASEQFKRNAKKHQGNAEAFFSQASPSQKERLEEAGIRDARDAGEYLHEMNSWAEQVNDRVDTMHQIIEHENQMLIDRGKWSGVNPITGQRLPDSPFADIEDTRVRLEWEENFRRGQEESVLDMMGVDAIEELIRRELQIENNVREEKDEEEIGPRSAKALNRDAIKQWNLEIANDEEKSRKLHSSVLYQTIKRKIQRENEKRKKQMS